MATQILCSHSNVVIFQVILRKNSIWPKHIYRQYPKNIKSLSSQIICQVMMYIFGWAHNVPGVTFLNITPIILYWMIFIFIF